jgi:iron complex outermembrane receptor protein
VTFSDNLHARIRVEAMQHNRRRDGLYVCPATSSDESQMYLDLDYREYKYLGAANIRWQVNPNHRVLIGLGANQVDIDKATWDFFGQPVAIPPT